MVLRMTGGACRPQGGRRSSLWSSRWQEELVGFRMAGGGACGLQDVQFVEV